jgi:hypothetical protein
MRRTVIALVTALALVACGGGDDGETASGTTETEPSSTATETPTETMGATALDGTWSASDITTAEIRRAIEREGFGDEELEVFLGDMGASESLDLTWKAQGGTYTLVGVADGANDIGRIDAADLEVDGDTVTFKYFSGGSSTLRWSIDGDRLEFELLEDTQADVNGISTEVFVAGLYTAAPWERVAS